MSIGFFAEVRMVISSENGIFGVQNVVKCVVNVVSLWLLVVKKCGPRVMIASDDRYEPYFPSRSRV